MSEERRVPLLVRWWRRFIVDRFRAEREASELQYERELRELRTEEVKRREDRVEQTWEEVMRLFLDEYNLHERFTLDAFMNVAGSEARRERRGEAPLETPLETQGPSNPSNPSHDPAHEPRKEIEQ